MLRSVAYKWLNFQATRKGSDQTARSEIFLVAHIMLLEISCGGSNIFHQSNHCPTCRLLTNKYYSESIVRFLTYAEYHRIITEETQIKLTNSDETKNTALYS